MRRLTSIYTRKGSGGTLTLILGKKCQAPTCNHEGQILWMKKYIRPQLEQLIEDYDLDDLRNPIC